jgi:hypothetical protein
MADLYADNLGLVKSLFKYYSARGHKYCAQNPRDKGPGSYNNGKSVSQGMHIQGWLIMLGDMKLFQDDRFATKSISPISRNLKTTCCRMLFVQRREILL